MTDTLHLPFMKTRWEYNFKKSAFSISIHPHPSMLGHAFADFIRYLAARFWFRLTLPVLRLFKLVQGVTLMCRHVGWKSLVILYETEEGLVRLQEVLRLQNTFRADAIKVAAN